MMYLAMKVGLALAGVTTQEALTGTFGGPFLFQHARNLILPPGRIVDTSKNSEFAQMQGAGKILHIPRAEYIRRAIAAMNNEMLAQKRREHLIKVFHGALAPGV